MTAAPRSPVHLRQMRQRNLGVVLRALADRPSSRAELAQRTGLTKATVASLVEPLVANRVLAEDAAEVAGRGRPSRPLRFHPDGPVTIGAEVNVDYVAAAALTLDGRVQASRRHEVDNRGQSAAQVIDALATLVDGVRAEIDRPMLGAGLALPGVVRDGVLVRAPNLPLLVRSRLGSELARAVGFTSVETDNEANLAACAHLWPHRAAGPDFVYISGEVGVGAGVVMNGELYRGATGFAGEFGHVVVEREGRACGCGGQGCVEQYAGLTAILRAAKRRKLAALLRALCAGEPTACRAVGDAGTALGVAICSLVNILDIPTIVLGGVYAPLFEYLRPAVTTELDRRVLRATQRPTELCVSELASEAAVRGAAAMISQRACSEPEILMALHRI